MAGSMLVLGASVLHGFGNQKPLLFQEEVD